MTTTPPGAAVSAQPDALRLADALGHSTSPWTGERIMFAEAAAELRRLHAQVAALTQGAAERAVPADAASERALFKEQFRHLDLEETTDAWGRPRFRHSHVDAMWTGWRQRAAVAMLAASPAQPAARAPVGAAGGVAFGWVHPDWDGAQGQGKIYGHNPCGKYRAVFAAPQPQAPAATADARHSCFDAADMATASAEGFRAGQNSVKQGGA